MEVHNEGDTVNDYETTNAEPTPAAEHPLASAAAKRSCSKLETTLDHAPRVTLDFGSTDHAMAFLTAVMAVPRDPDAPRWPAAEVTTEGLVGGDPLGLTAILDAHRERVRAAIERN